MVIKQINKFSRKKEEKPVENKKKCQYCYSEIHINATRCPNCTAELNENLLAKS